MFLRTFIVCALFAGAASGAGHARQLDASAFPPEIIADTRAAASRVSAAALPDGLIATGEADIRAAWYEAPTRRYAHAILGDAIEAGALVVETDGGARLTLELPQHQVFEDRYPRIADLDGDGRAEVVTIRSSARGGGGVAVYGLREGRLSEIASVPDIGLRNRWLNIAAVADLDGVAGLEIAFVKTPHIGGTLRIFTYRDGSLVLLDEAPGFSNHFIGSPEMRLSALSDRDGDGTPELAVPSADRRSLRVMSAKGGVLREVAATKTPAPIDKPILATPEGWVVGLRNGEVWLIGDP